jgi:hypothetical protein
MTVWLQRNAWWGLVVIATLLVLFGLLDVASGAEADPAIPLALTGLTLAELGAESATGLELFDFMTRVNGWSLILLGGLLLVLLLVPFRRGERWAWWTMWAIPAWSIGAALFYVVAGVQPGVPPPPPMVSGPIVAVVSAAILLLSAPRFFEPPDPQPQVGFRWRSARMGARLDLDDKEAVARALEGR